LFWGVLEYESSESIISGRGLEGFQASVSKQTRRCGTPNTDKQPAAIAIEGYSDSLRDF
jgi:hypothetical protein